LSATASAKSLANAKSVRSEHEFYDKDVMAEAIAKTRLELATLLYVDSSTGNNHVALDRLLAHSRDKMHVIPPLVLKRNYSSSADLNAHGKCTKKSKVVITVVQPVPSLLTSVINAFKF
jgi:hypothetical protein